MGIGSLARKLKAELRKIDKTKILNSSRKIKKSRFAYFIETFKNVLIAELFMLR
jgi:hypothetical protein